MATAEERPATTTAPPVSRRAWSLERAILLPFTALERSRGWTRRLVVLTYAIVFAALGLLMFREARIAAVPRGHDPFDVAAFRAASVPDDRNAWVVYRDASARGWPFFASLAGSDLDWATTSPFVRRFAVAPAQTRALETWVEGASSSESQLTLADSSKADVPAVNSAGLRSLENLALLLASKKRDEGDFEGAWVLLRAALRHSRHLARNQTWGVKVQGRDYGVKVLQAITFWSEDPRNTLTLLRQAIADALEAQRLESMPSEFVKAEYIRLVQALADPDQRYHQIPKSPEGGEWQYSPAIQIPRLFVENEPELTLRLARQVYSRWLAQCDRPPVKRTPIHQVTHSASFYTTPANTDFGMTDADLAAWIDRSTLFSSYSTSLFLSLSLLDTDRDTPRRAALHLAQNLYVRESGKPPPSLGDLVGAWYPVGEPLPGEYRPSDPPLP